MSILNGPNEGNWSVFAAKVVEQRDQALDTVAVLKKNLKECQDSENILQKTVEFLRDTLEQARSHQKELTQRLSEITSWKCESCGCMFDNGMTEEAKLRGVTRCSKCVESEVLARRVTTMLAMMELVARDIGFVHRVGRSTFWVSDKLTSNPKLSDFGFSICCSDTFEWGCADSEAINIEQAPAILKLLDEQGWPAVMQWIKDKRADGSDFIKLVQDQIFENQALRAENMKLREHIEQLEKQLQP